MKRAGEILSLLFDERMVKKAHVYSSLFDYWEQAVRNNGLASAADHSRIRELDRGILLIETDHPGWKQIIQTKQGSILDDFRRNFPDLDISGISLILGRLQPVKAAAENEDAAETAPLPETELQTVIKAANVTSTASAGDESLDTLYGAIKDDALKEAFKRLERNITSCYTEQGK